MMTLEECLMEALAQGYCVEPNLGKVVDPNLITTQIKLALEKINLRYELKKKE